MKVNNNILIIFFSFALVFSFFGGLFHDWVLCIAGLHLFCTFSILSALKK